MTSVDNDTAILSLLQLRIIVTICVPWIKDTSPYPRLLSGDTSRQRTLLARLRHVSFPNDLTITLIEVKVIFAVVK